jgi:membrane protein DedA with SNARE-associated domain
VSSLSEAVIRYGLPLIFANVLAEQLGMPIPAIPTLIVAGALAVEKDLSASRVLLVALIACLIADTVWFLLGRRHGFRILKTLCRVSLSPDSCVRQTSTTFEAWGLPALLVAKFIPGFSTVAPPLAGATAASLPAFLFFDAGGSLLWAGAGVATGAVFHRAVDRALEFLESIGSWALVVLGAGLALFIAFKWWQRRRFYRMLRMARISAEELHRAIEGGEAPVIVDVRTGGARAADPRRIPGAIAMQVSELDERLGELPADREIVLYCT